MCDCCRKMSTTYTVKIMYSLYYRKVTCNWNQFVHVEKTCQSYAIQDILLHLCIIQQSYSIYTKDEKLHDKTNSHKLGDVDLHYYHNIQFYTRFLYTYTPYISNFIYLYLLYLNYLGYFIIEFTFYILHSNRVQ